MIVLLITTTTMLMFLAFGSLVLPIKAAVMSALTLGSTMGILTWMFVDGHVSGWLNYTPQPLMAPMIGLIIAVIYGLSTDYEVFLVSRMVEARERGMSTAEAIRIGTATTGRIITAAALVLAVVAGAFVFSDLVMMKYLAFGLLDRAAARRHRRADVPGAGGHEAARRRLLVGAAVDEAAAEPHRPGRDHLPDERKRPAVREPEEALVARRRPRCRRRGGRKTPRTRPSRARLARHRGPSHRGSRRPRPSPAPRGCPAPVEQSGDEPTTTRLSVAAKNAAKAVITNATGIAQRVQRSAPPATPAPAPRPDREIESWLGELRGTAPGPAAPPERPATPRPSADPTRAMPEAPAGGTDDAETTAIPKADKADPEATEKLPKPDERRRGGVSAQDLLRREGRRL